MVLIPPHFFIGLSSIVFLFIRHYAGTPVDLGRYDRNFVIIMAAAIAVTVLWVLAPYLTFRDKSLKL